MTYRVQLTNDALKTLKKLDKPMRRRIQLAILRLAEDPRPPSAIPVRGLPDHLRIRVGSCRVIYSIEERQVLIEIFKIGYRRDVYER